MLGVEEIVRSFAPGLLPAGPVSVAYIRTTRPKYLLFAGSASSPSWVVQFGALDDLIAAHRAQSRLHSQLPGMVGNSVMLEPCGPDRYLNIQQGMPGTPWFRLRARNRSARDWSQAVERAQHALDRLHHATMRYPEWVCSVRPADALRDEVGELTKRLERVPAGLVEWTARHADRLEELHGIESCVQHGDFCFNNLLVADSGVAVIDFEEFGLTSMPLHDAIGLELSLEELAPSLGIRMRRAILQVALDGHGGRIRPRHLAGLHMHYFAWRINRSVGVPKRARAMALWLDKASELLRSDDWALA